VETKEIIRQTGKLPQEDKMLILEKTVKSIRENEIKNKMARAVSELMEENRSNKKLTTFTEIDFVKKTK